MYFENPAINNPLIVLLFAVLTALVFSMAGMTNAIYAKKFDDVSIIPTFILTPLTYLGGVFYSLGSISNPIFQTITKFNPVVYMVDGFRYGFYSKADFSLLLSGSILVISFILLTILNSHLLTKGKGMRS